MWSCLAGASLLFRAFSLAIGRCLLKCRIVDTEYESSVEEEGKKVLRRSAEEEHFCPLASLRESH